MNIQWDAIVKQILGKTNLEEDNIISAWSRNNKRREKFIQDTAKYYKSDYDSDLNNYDADRAWEEVLRKSNQKRTKSRWIRSLAIPAAAAVLILLLLNQVLFDSSDKLKKNIAPGSRSAQIFLPSGEKFKLDTLSEAKLKSLGIVNKPAESLGMNMPDEVVTVVVPRYCEYKIILSDGTKVWLNSESSLKFSKCFNGKCREVELVGEGYFDVVKDSVRKFIVHVKDLSVVVYGTQFNVRAHSGSEVVTSLVSGSVALINKNCSKRLVPGERGTILANGNILVEECDLESITAWKNGEIIQKNQNLEQITSELQRWYDVDVIFVDEEVRNYRFSLFISRSAYFEEILDKLEKTEKIRYRIDGKRVYIYKAELN